MRWIFTSLILLCFASPTMGATKQTNWLRVKYDCGDDVCIVRENYGGTPLLHRWAAERVLEKGTQVRIEGICYSACVIFASMARTNVCITGDAKMGIHLGIRQVYYNEKHEKVDITSIPNFEWGRPPPKGFYARDEYFTPKYGDDIIAWADQHGKMTGDEMYVMTHEEALQFWRPCP